MKKSKSTDMIVIGFALFAMFFGSGNLIFPPYLGRLVGREYWIGFIGFMIMGIGLPLLGVMATAKVEGNFSVVTDRIGRTFSVCLMTALVLAIGPFLAIPRTAATTYEISVKTFLPMMSPIVVIGIYFVIVLAFVMNPNSIIDVIGKFLTPVLLITLLMLIVKGIIYPIGPSTETTLQNVFASSLIEGYQTMDALGAICFGGIIVKGIKEKGYTTGKEIVGVALRSSIVAVVGLGIIYGGLMYLGGYTGHIAGNIEKTVLVTTIAQQILGQIGLVFLAVAVFVACLTTSIGLTMTAADYFSGLSKGKISYNAVAIIVAVVSMGIALMGVDNIVGITTPVLKILYPMIIILVITTLLESEQTSPLACRITIYTTLIITVIEEISYIGNIEGIQKVIGYLPLSRLGFVWVIPAIIVYFVVKVLDK